MFLLLKLLGPVVVCALLLLVAISRHKKRAGRVCGLRGRTGTVVAALRPEGAVLIDGELWRAVATDEEILSGRVCVVGARGHRLEVKATR
jgi:membrane-bound ClpP family serine protease